MNIDLDQLAALEQAATPGPWQYVPGYEAVYGPEPTDEQKKAGAARREVVGPVLLAVMEECYLEAETAALIVAMRNALPELIERVRAAEFRADIRSDTAPMYLDRALAAESRVAELEAWIIEIGFCPECRSSMPCMGCIL